MSKKKIGVIAGAILFAALAAVGIWYFLGNGGRDSNDRVYVEKVSAIMGKATGAQNRFAGVVQPQETVEINADSERTVKEVLVEVGDAVMEGTPLFTYDTEDLNLELAQAKLELENQDIEISNYRRQIQELQKERTAAAEGDKFEYTTQIQTIETQIKQAEFAKSSKQLEMDKIQKRVDNSQVVSTASGVIKTINNEGQSQNDDSSAFITILSTGEYRIKGTANEQNVGMISSGLDVIVRSRVDESITWMGTIEELDTERPSTSSDDDMGYGADDGANASSDYSFYVTMADADGLMLGQHVFIELDEGQTEEKEGIWLFSGYIVFEEDENGSAEEMEGASEFLEGDTELFFDEEDGMAMLSDVDESGEAMESNIDGDMDIMSGIEDDMEYFSEFGEGEESLFGEEGSTEYSFGGQTAFVWADNGNGRLEKRAVEVGEYDFELDEYEILSGLSEEDLIAWPMDGLYEGVKTVTDADEVDYSSGLYNQEMDSEDMWNDPEYDDWNEDNYEGDEFYDGDYSGEEDYSDDYSGEEDYSGEDYEDDNSGDEENGSGLGEQGGNKPVDLDDFLQSGGIR